MPAHQSVGGSLSTLNDPKEAAMTGHKKLFVDFVETSRLHVIEEDEEGRLAPQTHFIIPGVVEVRASERLSSVGCRRCCESCRR